MFLLPTNKSEIVKIINSFDSNKSSDIYGMSPRFLKMLSPAISETLSNIFNESFPRGVFPDHMKLGITPTFKGGSKLDVSNYRPVSVLLTISKILEKLMLFRLTKFLDKHNIIYEHQFGFPKNTSTTLAVLDLSTRIIKALDNGNYAASVFLDFGKAFDTANHEILIDKLENYGVRGIVKNWFELYLKNRHQIVKIGDTLSDKMQITCDVPQGSILGPILFLLYINDIKNSSKILKFFLFADDTSTSLISKDIQELESIYNKELSYVTDWLNAKKLTLNVKKSNLILFKNAKKPAKTLNIKIKREQIEEKEYTKYLGIIIDNKLSWNYHIKHANLKISKGIGILTKLRRYLSKNLLRTLFYAFVQPHIDYGLLVWGRATPNNLKPIKKNLQKVVRKILFKARNQPIEPLFHELNMLDFEKHKYLTISSFMWQLTYDNIPATIKSSFNARKRGYGESNHKYHVPNVNSELSKRTIIYQGPKIWKKLKTDVKNKTNIFSFKRFLKNEFLKKDLTH